MPRSSQQAWRCRLRRLRPPTMPVTPLPVTRGEIRDVRAGIKSALARPQPRWRRPADARSSAPGWRRAPAPSASSKPAAGTHGDHARLAFGQRAGLVDDQRVDFLEALQRLGVLDQHARGRALADADHDRHRRREAERAGAGDDEHRDRGDQRIGEGRRRPARSSRPRTRRSPTAMTAGTNQAATTSASRWIGARLRCASATICTMRASIVSAPILSARITRLPVPLMVPPISLAPGAFSTGIDSPVTIDSSTALLPSMHDAVHRHAVAGPHAQAIADMHLLQRDFLIAAVVADPPRGLRREVEQRADGAAGLLAGAQFQHLPEQHQDGDHRRGFEIDRHDAVRLQALRETGRARTWRQGCRHRRHRRRARSG